MQRNTSISLGDHFAGFVDEQVRAGRFASVSEVVRAGLRLLEEQETKLETLRRALGDGEASGPGEPFEIDEFLSEMRRGSSAR